MATYDITTLGSPLEFDTTNCIQPSICQLTDTRFVIAWKQANGVSNVQAFDLNRSTGAITALSTPVNFYSTSRTQSVQFVLKLDDTHVMILWEDVDQDGRAVMYTVNAGTGAMTATGSVVEFETSNCNTPSAALVDATHVIAQWGDGSSNLMCALFSFNTSTGGITNGTPTTVSFGGNTVGSIAALNSTKATVMGAGTDNDLFIDTFSYDTGANTTTNLAGPDEMTDNLNVNSNSVILMDLTGSTATLIDFYQSNSGAFTGKVLRQFTVNVSNGAFATLGTASLVDAATSTSQSGYSCAKIDSTHLMVVYQGASADGFARTYSLNLGTGALASLSTVEFDTADCVQPTVCDMGSGLYVVSFQGVSADGFAQCLSVELPASGPANLKSLDGNLKANIKSFDGNLIANIKSISGNS